MGATPELLLRDTSDGYETMALAGTQPVRDSVSEAVWSSKEIAEQKYLVDFINATLDGSGTSYAQGETRTVDTGSVMHICTDFRIDRADVSMIDLAKSLHPGPAISGYPVTTAREIIPTIEKHDRLDYCGYFGPMGIEGRKELYINLRSMQVCCDGYRLYVGGGLTGDSDAMAEWRETELKARTLMNYLPSKS